MNKKLFAQLVRNLKEAQAIAKGKIKASRRFVLASQQEKVAPQNAYHFKK